MKTPDPAHPSVSCAFPSTPSTPSIPRTRAYNYSLEHVQDLKMHCFSARLSMPELFRFATLEVLQACYNGIGPDRWSSRFRRFTTWILTFLEAPALIHDWEFTYQPKTYGAFTMANLRLAYNAAKDKHPFSGITAAILCQLFGWRGYKTGGKNT